ncbi:hypothetical protein HPC49_09965 [Pyxidicoccus fallax]|uniref:Lipoprotein n=1 Tax=Pyxidicoccus fallax TaxID=394095 RepID=A0A848LIJ8_9BACT|nr:hypothetical protein [Pyxidicoccus fallax]NMO17539.1 hypothetical protein [Pyxidicoccus fallax]NPC78567.1 hypothetical protein [Pyxidicoccus fallax]
MTRGWRWAGALLMAGAMWTAAGCGSESTGDAKQDTPGLDAPTPPEERPEDPPVNPEPRPDGGTVDPEPDSGTPDAGPGTPDGGEDPVPDAGTPDSGTPDSGTPDSGTPDAGVVELKYDLPASSSTWEFYGRAQGGPRFVYGVTADEGGNVWVAGGEEGLFLMKKGEKTFRRFTMADGLRPYGYMPDGSEPPGAKYLKVISVAGAWDGTVFVGYAGKDPAPGMPGCEDEWADAHQRRRQPIAEVYKSGDADRVSLRADGTLDVVHYDISSGPNVVGDEPEGREKLCNIWRIVYHKHPEKPERSSVWFGANHGFARGDAHFKGAPRCNGQLACSGVEEHSHPGFNAYVYSHKKEDEARYGKDYSKYRVKGALLTDAYWGLALMPNGDVWVGGANRSTRYFYGTTNGDFWECQTRTEHPDYAWNRIDIWKDAVGEGGRYSRPEERTEDLVSGMAVVGDTVWVGSFGNGLAQLNDRGEVLRTLRNELAAPHVASVAADPLDGSVWTGTAWGGGLSRVRSAVDRYGYATFGRELASMPVPDIQVDRTGAKRRMLVAFQGTTQKDGTVVPGAIGIYSGD